MTTDDYSPSAGNAAQAVENAQGVTRNNSAIQNTHAAASIRASVKISRERAAEHFASIAPGADKYLIDARAPGTWCAVDYRLRRYLRWCEDLGLTPLPCSGDQLRQYVKFLIGEGLSPSTLRAYVAGIRTAGRLNDRPVDASLIGEHLRAARRRHGPQRRARPLRAGDLENVLAQLHRRKLRDMRDAVALALGFAAAARGSEIVGLDWERPGSEGNTGVVQRVPGGLLIRWHRSKTAQAEEIEVSIPHADMPFVRTWLRRWLTAAKIAPGTPIIRPISRWGAVMPARMAAASLSGIIRVRVLDIERARGTPAAGAKARAARFSSHSLRRGYCTSAAENGVPLATIRQRSRHADDAMVARYVGEAEGRRRSGLEGLFGKGKP